MRKANKKADKRVGKIQEEAKHHKKKKQSVAEYPEKAELSITFIIIDALYQYFHIAK
jgi:hypothetical protein